MYNWPALQPHLSLKTYRELDIVRLYQGLYRLSAATQAMYNAIQEFDWLSGHGI